MFYPTTCVGFRYGPAVYQTTLAVFLGSLLLRRYPSAHAPPVLSDFSHAVSADMFAFALQRTIPSVRGRFASPSPLGLYTPG